MVSQIQSLNHLDRILTIARGMIADPLRGNEYQSDDLPHFFFVDSGRTDNSDSNDGRDPNFPLSTIDAAINKCTAGRNDIIFVLPGHTETISAAAAITMDKVGVTIQGLGDGANKPTITLDTDVGTDVLVTANSCRISNIRFVSGINSLASIIDVNAATHLVIEDCDFISSSANEYVVAIDFAVASDQCKVLRCTFLQPTDPDGSDAAAGTGAITMVDCDDMLIKDCYFNGFFETAIIHSDTTLSLALWVVDCIGIQLLSTAEPFQLVSGTTGGAVRCSFNAGQGGTSEAALSGTFGALFFNYASLFGNDGGGGQLALPTHSDLS